MLNDVFTVCLVSTRLNNASNLGVPTSRYRLPLQNENLVSFFANRGIDFGPGMLCSLFVAFVVYTRWGFEDKVINFCWGNDLW